MKIRFSGRQQVYMLLASLLVFFIVMLALSEGYYGGGDNLSHYKYSRYSSLHPEFLLYHWGKPVFTLIMFPFAQFGFTGVQVFNIIAGLISAYICYLIARHYNYPNAPLTIIFLCFTPIYTVIMMSGMTEILFGLFCILSVYLIIKEKYIISSIVISFSFLVRTEGIYIIPVIGLALLIRKRYKALPFLLTGFIVYSIIGYFYYRDIFWLITEMPYRGATELFGTGSILHYVNSSHRYFGNAIRYLLGIGIITIIIMLIRRSRESMDEALLIALPFLVYFAAHSLMWWSGIGNSDGNLRYMAAIAPFVSLISLKGFNILLKPKFISRIPWLRYSIMMVICITVIIIPFDIYSIPVKLRTTQKLVSECSRWLESSVYINRKFYYYDPDFIYFLNFNPYDENISHQFLYSLKRPEKKIDNGSAVIWDAHYSPNWRLPLKKLMENPYFKLVNVFIPERNFKRFGRDYKICVFERTGKTGIDNYKIMKLFENNDFPGYRPLIFTDFDDKFFHRDSVFINDDIAFSGNRSIKINSSKPFFLTCSFRISDISRKMNDRIMTSFKIFITDTVNHPVLLVRSFEHKNNPYLYSAFKLDKTRVKPGKWYTVRSVTVTPEPVSDDDILKIYFWNKEKNESYIDDLFIGIKEE